MAQLTRIQIGESPRDSRKIGVLEGVEELESMFALKDGEFFEVVYLDRNMREEALIGNNVKNCMRQGVQMAGSKRMTYKEVDTRRKNENVSARAFFDTYDYLSNRARAGVAGETKAQACVFAIDRRGKKRYLGVVQVSKNAERKTFDVAVVNIAEERSLAIGNSEESIF